ncbi:MAG: hypothetical protein ACOX1P_13815 [Thermoguttaceae bacterium]|jgi:hypothetical protein
MLWGKFTEGVTTGKGWKPAGHRPIRTAISRDFLTWEEEADLTYEGSRLLVNFATSAAGGRRVELQDAQSKPIPGFTLADCPEHFGHSIDHRPVSNKGHDHEQANPGRLDVP